MIRFVFASLLFLSLAPLAQAGSVQVYRCTASDGGVSLQDRPCPASQQQQQRTLSTPNAPLAPAAAMPIAAASGNAPPPAAEPPRARRQPAPLYLCERYDGVVSESATGIPERRWVPLWALGADPRAPATVLDPQTIGRTSPLRQTARDGTPALQVSAMTLGTWVEDVCRELTPEAICTRRRETLAGFGRRIFNAGQSQGDQLRAEESALRATVAEECG